jgi:hypothetical protein
MAILSAPRRSERLQKSHCEEQSDAAIPTDYR